MFQPVNNGTANTPLRRLTRPEDIEFLHEHEYFILQNLMMRSMKDGGNFCVVPVKAVYSSRLQYWGVIYPSAETLQATPSRDIIFHDCLFIQNNLYYYSEERKKIYYLDTLLATSSFNPRTLATNRELLDCIIMGEQSKLALKEIDTVQYRKLYLIIRNLKLDDPTVADRWLERLSHFMSWLRDIPFEFELHCTQEALENMGATSLKKYLRFSYPDLPVKDMIRAVREGMPNSEISAIQQLAKYATDPQELFRCLANKCLPLLSPPPEKESQFDDRIESMRDALQLCRDIHRHHNSWGEASTIKVNPHWSLRRMQEEEENLTMQYNRLRHGEIDLSNLDRGPYRHLLGHPTFRVLTTSDDIYLEGRIQHHCVGTYVPKVKRGQCCIFTCSYEENGEKRRYTGEVVVSAFRTKYSLDQLKGVFNNPAPKPLVAQVQRWLIDKSKELSPPSNGDADPETRSVSGRNFQDVPLHRLGDFPAGIEIARPFNNEVVEFAMNARANEGVEENLARRDHYHGNATDHLQQAIGLEGRMRVGEIMRDHAERMQALVDAVDAASTVVRSVADTIANQPNVWERTAQDFPLLSPKYFGATPDEDLERRVPFDQYATENDFPVDRDYLQMLRDVHQAFQWPVKSSPKVTHSLLDILTAKSEPFRIGAAQQLPHGAYAHEIVRRLRWRHEFYHPRLYAYLELSVPPALLLPEVAVDYKSQGNRWNFAQRPKTVSSEDIAGHIEGIQTYSSLRSNTFDQIVAMETRIRWCQPIDPRPNVALDEDSIMKYTIPPKYLTSGQ